MNPTVHPSLEIIRLLFATLVSSKESKLRFSEKLNADDDRSPFAVKD